MQATQPLKMTLRRLVQALDLPPSDAVRPDDSALQSLQWMREEQLSAALVEEDGEFCGLLTLGGMSDQLLASIGGEPPILRVDLQAMVEDFMVHRPPTVDGEATMSDCLDGLRNTEALVLICDGLKYIITHAEISEFLQAVTEPFLLIQEIETSLRSLINHALADATQSAIANSLKHRYSGDRQLPTRTEDLAFGELIQVIVQKENFANLESIFGRSREAISQRLNPLSGLRNEVFHFRRALTPQEISRLRRQREWLVSKANRAVIRVA